MYKLTAVSTLLYVTTLMWTTEVTNGQGQTLASLLMAGMQDNNAVQNFVTEEDDTVALICNIIGFTDDQIVSITRATDFGAEDSLLWNKNTTLTESTRHIEFDGYVEIGPGVFLYTMIVHNVTKYDAGDYACTVFSQSGNRFIPVTGAQSNLRILHFPEDIYPACSIVSTDKSLTRYVGDIVTFRCESEIGDPEVFLDWSLSARGPSLPRPDESKTDRITSTEIVVTLKQGHTGKLFECEITSGLDITRRPKCTIGPYSVIARPTTPRPPTTKPRPPNNPGTATKSDIAVEPSKTTTPSQTKPSDMMRSPPGVSTGLGSAAIAGICVIIVLFFGILVILLAAYLIRTNKYWSPEAKSPYSEKSVNTSHMSGQVDDMDGPQLLGFKKRLSKKISLKSENGDVNEKYGIENGVLKAENNYDTINESGESKPSTPLTSHKPLNINPIYGLDHKDPNPPSPSPTSPQANQPFLQTTQSDEGFVSPPDSPDVPQSPEDTADAKVAQPATPSSPPSSPSAQDTDALGAHARNPSFISVDSEDNMIEGEFVSDSEQLQVSSEHEDVFDPSVPRNLPQDVMDILMDLDLDLFANEVTEDTVL